MRDIQILKNILLDIDNHEYEITEESDSRHVNNAYTLVDSMRQAFADCKFHDLWLLRKQLEKDIRLAIGEILCEEYLMRVSS